ncbi:GTB-type domain-containing protein [Moumouvirus goulette]|uniref:GTB-type domain-containing protein n=1 Tax=Moumouvirus goulette TaxID=1247379 RepID=M1NML5_9VIRU|nr:GTB-type domain-containing protein [Moumouvirus goulette]AGF85285.1 GTB-type domain-containing protein [Moumouvirus goulette]
MIKFVIVNPFDIILYMMPYTHLFRSMSQLFYKINSTEYMRNHGIEVIPVINFLDDVNLKYDLMNYNVCEDYYTNNSTSTSELHSIFIKCVTNFINKIKTTDEYDNCVIYGIEPTGFDPFFAWDVYPVLKSKNIKTILYLDDLHAFIMANTCCSITDICQKDITEFKFKDHRLENCNYMLSMSKIFHHIGIYQDKIKFYYVPVDDIIYSMYTPYNHDQRKNKILLTGTIAGYPLRIAISGAYYNIHNKNNTVAKEYYDVLTAIGYHVTSLDNCKTIGLCAYYNRLAEYQGAFVGYFWKPLDHILWKIFEILATGTLLFAEENKTLEELGMRKFVHYVPMNENNIFDKEYLAKYLGTEKGKEIAINGYNFIKEFHSNKKNLDYFINMIKSL